MYVCAFITLTVTSNQPIWKAHVCLFSSFFVTSNPSFFKARVTRVTRACCLRFWDFMEADLWLHLALEATGFFLRLDVVMKLKQFDITVDSALSIIGSLFLFYCLFIICCRVKITRLILKVVITVDTFIFGKKDEKLEQSSLRIISQRRNGKRGDLLHFPYF